MSIDSESFFLGRLEKLISELAIASSALVGIQDFLINDIPEDSCPTLRDRFAMAAMAGMLGACSGEDVSFIKPERAAALAYEYAEEMLQNRPLGD